MSEVAESAPEISKAPTQKDTWPFFIYEVSQRGVIDLRKALGIENGIRFVVSYGYHDARVAFLDRVLDEIQKAGMAMVKWEEQLADSPDSAALDSEDPLVRVMLRQTADDQSLWRRKLTEALVDLIGFTTTNSDTYYRHYLLYADLDYHQSHQMDLEEFHGARSGKVEHSITMVRETIGRLEAARFDLSKCWYLKERKPVAKAATKGGGVFASLRQRFKYALEHAGPYEKLMLGLSYGNGISEPSRDIHFHQEPDFFAVTNEKLEASVTACGALAMTVLLRCQDLTGIIPEGINTRIRQMEASNTEPAKILAQVTGNRAEVGDFVLAYGNLAEVIEVITGAFGYQSYRVRYLAERSLPDVPEEAVIAQYIQPFWPRRKFWEGFQRFAKEGKLPPEFLTRFETLSEEKRAEIFRTTITHAWNDFLKDYTHRRK